MPGRVSLLTSGSTGTPKLVSHRWDTLFTARGLQRVPPRRWLIPYQVGTYAWYQLATLGMFQPAQSLVVPASDDLETLFQEAAEQKVDSLSATPTFWRLACFRVPETLLRSVPLSTLTLGGELADQAILDRLAALFPTAQITHIYASTEAGACVVVKDGQAGFPREYLDRDLPDAPTLRIQEGRLWIRSPFSTSAAAGTPDGWLDSGDLVEIRGDRVYFLGRANAALINVGGNKAYPADIEAVLLAHPSVRWCRVRAVRSPLVGYLPEAEYVPTSREQMPGETELTEYCASRLPAYAVPRLWTALPEIPVQSTLKSAL
jgi:acyl-CoA synthetase (AMP-forming)/AMP-acid ligase II